MRKPLDWNKTFFNIAEAISQRSKDDSQQVGCVVVDKSHRIRSLGYNGMSSGINDADETGRYERPRKYFFFEHAERNAIYNACRAGTSLIDCKIFVPWPPCADCARAIIQAGLNDVMVLTSMVKRRWLASCHAGQEMFEEAGVLTTVYENEFFSKVYRIADIKAEREPKCKTTNS